MAAHTQAKVDSLLQVIPNPARIDLIAAVPSH